MKRNWNAYAKILAVIAVLFLMAGGWILARRRANITEAAKLPFYNVELSEVEDGEYYGKTYTSFLHLQLKVFVQNHTITNIEVIESEGIDSETAKPILQDMIAQNKVVVKAIKGAELGSLVYISCVDGALYNGKL
ncbi:MAG: hypothetical protein MR852_10580 [Treponema sp.]|nr:hypothetical protein [Treponema sp.]MCI7567070.1 hypothetical protein [Treponema sp.]